MKIIKLFLFFLLLLSTDVLSSNDLYFSDLKRNQLNKKDLNSLNLKIVTSIFKKYELLILQLRNNYDSPLKKTTNAISNLLNDLKLGNNWKEKIESAKASLKEISEKKRESSLFSFSTFLRDILKNFKVLGGYEYYYCPNIHKGWIQALSIGEKPQSPYKRACRSKVELRTDF